MLHVSALTSALHVSAAADAIGLHILQRQLSGIFNYHGS